MSKNENKNLIIAGSIIAGFLILWLIYDRNRIRELLEYSKDENDILEQDNQILMRANSELVNTLEQHEANMESLKSMIDNSNHIEDEVKKKITNLINKYNNIDSKVSNELIAAMALIEAKQPTKAAFSLAKIVENLLEDKYSKSELFKEFIKKRNNGKKRNPVFNDFLEYAKDQKLIEKDEFHFAKGLKEIRNEEGHELDVRKQENTINSAFLIGIGLIMKLGQFIKN